MLLRQDEVFATKASKVDILDLKNKKLDIKRMEEYDNGYYTKFDNFTGEVRRIDEKLEFLEKNMNVQIYNSVKRFSN